MKLFVLAVFAFLVFGGIQIGNDLITSVSERANVATTFINDSVIVDIPDDAVEGGGGSDTPEEIVLESNDNEEVIVFSDPDEGGSDNVIEEVVVVVSPSGGTDEEGGSSGEIGSGGSDGISQNDTNTSNSGGTEQVVSAQEVFNTLTGNQAVTHVSGGSGSASGGGSGTSVSGTKTREALLARGITSITIPAPPQEGLQTASRPSYSRADLALIVSSEMVRNPDIDDVFYTTDTLSITYQARGRLLFALPLPYTAQLSLSFNAPTTKERVRVTFPWFTFLMWTGVSKSTLQDQVDTVITDAPSGID